MEVPGLDVPLAGISFSSNFPHIFLPQTHPCTKIFVIAATNRWDFGYNAKHFHNVRKGIH